MLEKEGRKAGTIDLLSTFALPYEARRYVGSIRHRSDEHMLPKEGTFRALKSQAPIESTCPKSVSAQAVPFGHLHIVGEGRMKGAIRV